MAINLLNIQPHKVSRDLSGYITYIYGAGGTGKTTLACQMDKALLLACERGYNALPGVMAQDITSWSEMKQVVRELKRKEVRETFKCVIVDTVDIASSFCEKYICNQLGIENIGDGGWTKNGWAKTKKEFESTMREIAQLGYALFFISHDKDKTDKTQDGLEYTKTIPSLSNAYNEIVRNMADIQGYAHPVKLENGVPQVMLTLRSMDGSVECKSRFKYIEPEIPFNYESLSKALNDAIEKEAALNNNEFVTDERAKQVEETVYDFEAMKNEFKELTVKIQHSVSKDEFKKYWAPKIIEITDKYLGVGKKVNDCTAKQAEQLSLILDDLKDLLSNGIDVA